MRPDGSEEGVRRSVDACIDGLGGTKFLDLFECARVDPNTPIETTIVCTSRSLSFLFPWLSYSRIFLHDYRQILASSMCLVV